MSREVSEALAFYLSSALSSFYEIKEENKTFSSSNITYDLLSCSFDQFIKILVNYSSYACVFLEKAVI